MSKTKTKSENRTAVEQAKWPEEMSAAVDKAATAKGGGPDVAALHHIARKAETKRLNSLQDVMTAHFAAEWGDYRRAYHKLRRAISRDIEAGDVGRAALAAATGFEQR